MISLVVLSFDYWAVERRQSGIWMPLAKTIRSELPAEALIITVSGPDPTLLNLARRQGWLISSEKITPSRIAELKQAGASHLAGSFLWEETYQSMPEVHRKKLHHIASSSNDAWIHEDSQTYLVPIKALPNNF